VKDHLKKVVKFFEVMERY